MVLLMVDNILYFMFFEKYFFVLVYNYNWEYSIEKELHGKKV